MVLYTLFCSEREARNSKRKKAKLGGWYTRTLMRRSTLVISAGKELFESFFSTRELRRQLGTFQSSRVEDSGISSKLKARLTSAEALITTWDSPKFGEDLTRIAPRLRIIAHCGGEVKSRFAQPLFKQLTITNAAVPMARATAEMAATLLLYCAPKRGFLSERVSKTLAINL